MAFYDQILNVAISGDWVSLGINLILSTIIGGIIIVIVLSVFSKLFNKTLNYPNSFLMVLIINIINFFGVLAFLGPALPAAATMIIPIFIWIILSKVFFVELKLWQAAVLGLIGYGLSILLVPAVVAYFAGYIPTFGF